MKLLARPGVVSLFLFAGTALTVAGDFRHGQPPQSAREAAAYVPDLTALSRPASSELRELVERYCEDRAAFERFHVAEGSARQVQRMRAFHQAWLTKLEQLSYEPLGVEGRIDWHLLRGQLRYELGLLDRVERRNADMAPLLPFAEDLARLVDERREFTPASPREAAAVLAKARQAADEARRSLEKAKEPPSRIAALRAANRLESLGKAVEDWFKFRDGYDPEFAWWTREPYRRLTAALAEHGKFLREKVVGQQPGEDEPIVGDPIGADGLRLDLEREMIPYSPVELVRLAERELAWCEAEWRKVARELGRGDDWKAVLEQVKADHVAPGEQPALIAGMAYEAIAFVTQRDLITVPPHAIDSWRMSMLSPERQKVAPFFLGGEQVLVAFPTDTMDHAEKLDSLRANNRHFSRAVVHHELIPGHHLQQWSWTRFNPHRRLFSTPFWVEGWALWWEFRLWDLGFARTPEQRAGMLFWRTHRAARIIFSLKFHLGEWSPQQCIDFLVDRVGHDRHTATGEVRRSFNGDYSPLYQVAYMMGAIQLRALYAELVAGGRMSEKDFHDRILQGGIMPIEMVRARLTGSKLPRDHASGWKFAGEQP